MQSTTMVKCAVVAEHWAKQTVKWMLKLVMWLELPRLSRLDVPRLLVLLVVVVCHNLLLFGFVVKIQWLTMLLDSSQVDVE